MCGYTRCTPVLSPCAPSRVGPVCVLPRTPPPPLPPPPRLPRLPVPHPPPPPPPPCSSRVLSARPSLTPPRSATSQCCMLQIINHMTEAGSHTEPLSPRTGTVQSHSQPATRQMYLFETQTPIRLWAARTLRPSASPLFWYFNKYQAQTRLGASSLRNVSEGSAITHNKWAYANSGVFAMHKSLFGARC